MPSRYIMLTWIMLALTSSLIGSDVDRVVGRNPQGSLRLKKDAYLTGALVSSESLGMIRWQHPQFVEPFEFPLQTISAINFPVQQAGEEAAGEFGFELISGTRLFGTIEAFEEPWLVIQSPTFGELRLELSSIRRIFRWNDGRACLFHGPGSLQEWTITNRQKILEVDDLESWNDVGFQLEANGLTDPIFRDIGLQQRSTIELELAWESAPNFILALATDGSQESYQTAFRIEIWNSAVVLVRELQERAMVNVLAQVEAMNGQLHLTIDLDQTNDQIVIYNESGTKLTTMQLGPGTDKPFTGVQVQNINGHLRLERIDVLTGAVVAIEADTDSADQFLTSTKQTISGRWVGYQAGMLQIQQGETVESIATEQLDLAMFTHPAPSEPANQLPEEGREELDQRQLLLVKGGIRFSGQFQRVLDNQVEFATEHLRDSILVPLTDLSGLRRVTKSNQKSGFASGRFGTLVMNETNISGILMDSTTSEGRSCLYFAPKWSTVAAHLKPTASGQIIYHDSTEKRVRQTVAPARARRGNLLGAMVQAFATGKVEDREVIRLIHLRTGDSIPASVKAIDEQGILIDSVVTGERMIPHSQMKAAELRRVIDEATLEDAERQRLLTVPRMRKNAPPSHLLMSVDGDFLRGNLLKLDQEETSLEAQLKEITLSTRYIGKIIWFHADELEDDAKPTEPASTADSQETNNAPLQLLAVQRDGIRLTFVPQESGGGEIVGESKLLGACLVNLKTVDRLVFGSEIGTTTANLPFFDWRLRHAQQPAVFSESETNGEGESMAGTSSPLVGQPAPDFKLKTLDGDDFQLSQQQGKVVVLDFWATWCGPCLQAMPQIDQAVAAFPADQVQLVAVNLQESADQIRATLKRLELEPNVVLDIDGVAAGRYQANAIPQTVVIDANGKITRLFVGGGAQLKSQLSSAIQKALDTPPSQSSDESSSQ
ncbi:TlpA family protein disulfide reductase [Planctomycetaceae bacterium SH139]